MDHILSELSSREAYYLETFLSIKTGQLKKYPQYMFHFILQSIDNTLEYVMNPYTFSKGIAKTEVAIKLQMTVINQMK